MNLRWCLEELEEEAEEEAEKKEEEEEEEEDLGRSVRAAAVCL